MNHPKSTKQGRYLIGPVWYDTYFGLLKTLLSIVPGIVVAVLLVVNLARPDVPVGQSVANALLTGFSVVMHLAFWVTLVFVFMERSGMKPDGLEVQAPIPATQASKRQIPFGEAIAGAVVVALGALWVAASFSLHVKEGQPLLNPELWSFWLPAFFVLAGLSVVHELLQAKVGNWTPPLMATNVLLSAACIVFVISLVSSVSVVNPAYLEAWGVHAANPGVATALRMAGASTVVVIVGVYIWDAVQSVMLNRRLGRR